MSNNNTFRKKKKSYYLKFSMHIGIGGKKVISFIDNLKT